MDRSTFLEWLNESLKFDAWTIPPSNRENGRLRLIPVFPSKFNNLDETPGWVQIEENGDDETFTLHSPEYTTCVVFYHELPNAVALFAGQHQIMDDAFFAYYSR